MEMLRNLVQISMAEGVKEALAILDQTLIEDVEGVKTLILKYSNSKNKEERSYVKGVIHGINIALRHVYLIQEIYSNRME